MLRDLSISVSPILAVLLIVLTPVSAGQGAHRDQLFDPLFPHVHFGTGVLTTAQTAAVQKITQRILKRDTPGSGETVGAGAGAAGVLVSVGSTPPVPGWLSLVPTGTFAWRTVRRDVLPPGALREAPPDPPPTAA